MDMYLPVDLESKNTPVIVIAAANKAKEHVIGVCALSDHNLGDVSFGTVAQHYLMMRGKDPMEVDISRVKIKVIDIVQWPKHGQLIMDKDSLYGSGIYRPDEGYFGKNLEEAIVPGGDDIGRIVFGKDRVEAIVSVGDDIVRVVYDFIVIQQSPTQPSADQLDESQIDVLCPKGSHWIISETLGNTMSFSDLSSSALAQITGTGASAQITFDLDAAGHGWYIDYTPYLNEEWLPTSNPYEWIAKPGSSHRLG
ncbi:MAG: hypothetical protein LBI59_04420 [Candidatus Accumulibacter sp.]|jgi:hypothetical protein|nr:hypothetical protein [Accumulibacter sp.]